MNQPLRMVPAPLLRWGEKQLVCTYQDDISRDYEIGNDWAVSTSQVGDRYSAILRSHDYQFFRIWGQTEQDAIDSTYRMLRSIPLEES